MRGQKGKFGRGVGIGALTFTIWGRWKLVFATLLENLRDGVVGGVLRFPAFDG